MKLTKFIICILMKNDIFEAAFEMGNESKFYTSLMVIYSAILMGMVFMISIAFYIRAYGQMIEEGAAWETLQFLVPLFAISCVMASFIIFKNRIFHIAENQDLTDKLKNYRTAFIMRLALLEAPMLFSSIAMILTGQEIFTLISLILIGVCVFIYPRKSQIADSLNLTQQEREQLFTTN